MRSACEVVCAKKKATKTGVASVAYGEMTASSAGKTQHMMIHVNTRQAPFERSSKQKRGLVPTALPSRTAEHVGRNP
jgi:hypothetical protein